MSEVYKYRPEISEENQRALEAFRHRVGIDSFPLNAVTNILMKIGMEVLDRSLQHAEDDVKKFLKDVYKNI
jgi:hypothetical protein